MKKKLIPILILIIILNTLIPKYIYATDTNQAQTSTSTIKKDTVNDVLKGFNPSIFSSFDNEGKAHGIDVTETASAGSNTMRAIAKTITLIPMVVSVIASIVAYGPDNVLTFEYTKGITKLSTEEILNKLEEDPDSIKLGFYFRFLTIGSIVCNGLALVNANYFNTDINSDGNSDTALKTNVTIKENVARWYNAIRLLAATLLLIVLIYIGIRMALSTVAEEKATYKKMLIDWLVSFALLFFLHYIIAVALYFSEQLLGLITIDKNKDFEQVILANLYEMIKNTDSWMLLYYAIIFCVLTFYQIKFFLVYVKRFITIGFLILIAPIITITYSIDKVANGKNDVLKVWFGEFMVNVFIQPFHAIWYFIMMNSAYVIFEKAPILALVFIVALSRGEKIVKQMFGLRGKKSIHSISDTFKFRVPKP